MPHLNSARRITYIFASAALLSSICIFCAASARTSHTATDSSYITGEYLITLHDGISPDVFVQPDLLPVPVELIDYSAPFALIRVPSVYPPQLVCRVLERQDYVKAAEANHTLTPLSATNDPYLGTQWSLQSKGQYDINATDAWDLYDRSIGGRTVVVAVIDTGVDYKHPDLKDAIWRNSGEIPGDGIDNDKNGYIDDVYGWDFYNNDSTVCHYYYDKKAGYSISDPSDSDDHGTHIAGIIAASSDNNTGIAGVASNVDVEIMILKALGSGSGNSPGKGSTFQAIKAIQYASFMGADLCNLSWGNTVYSSALEQAIRESDMLFVAAAGNNNSDNNERPVYPASFRLGNIISVTSSNQSGELAAYSNYGTNSVDIAAPGQNIFSTIVGSYSMMSGTSMAVPHVTAVAAMLYAYTDQLYPSNIADILISAGTPLPALENKITNPVLLNASNAVSSLDWLEPDSTAPSVSYTVSKKDSDYIVSIHASDRRGSGIRTIRYIFGAKTAAAFNHGIRGLAVENGTAILSKSGKYTIYVSDYAGNETVRIINVTSVPALSLKLSSGQTTLKLGQSYTPDIQILPFNHTDSIAISSSNPKIIRVSPDKTLKALKTGSSKITIKTSSGLKTTWTVTVIK